ncbi:uncharacterized protein [Halyomorpha halys]|uniref:uncharacterized protein isoform X2 n=1 Tax=Halyomorpha halys TaxID=286706 RepID=UPI0006D514BC|nr:uncharacterized protein LOC106682313 isoform X2 [Halyomorpha halys]
MPSGTERNENEENEENGNILKTLSDINIQKNGQDEPSKSVKASPPPPGVCVMANSVHKPKDVNVNETPNRGQKRGNYYQELWSHDDARSRKKMKKDSTLSEKNDLPVTKSPNEQFRYVCCARKPNNVINSTICRTLKPRKPVAKLVANPSLTVPKTQACRKTCRKTYYRKRRYCCPGKRRYKASKRCCPKRYKRTKINLCNRNWARISIHPFINFLRIFRRKFCKGTPISKIAKLGKCEWKKMTCMNKKKFYEQAKRARIRGYRT